jgi:uncharacterized membrane protein (UPF0127 family)
MTVLIIGKNKFPVKCCITNYEQSNGLKFIKENPPITIFPYNKKSIHKFWMEDTFCPLDLVFCCNDKIVALGYGKPLSKQLIGPDCDTDLVIEFPFGSIKKYNLSIDNDIKVNYSIEDLARLYENSCKLFKQ